MTQENQAPPPPPADFVHLHVHTHYSLLDGAIRPKDLMAKAKEFGMDTVTITDHGAMYGALEFYNLARKNRLKPIIGCEFYVAPEDRRNKNAKSAGTAAYHLVLLAMNLQGYRNLMRLASIAQLEGFYYKPRIDMEVLGLFNEGLIALTACLHGTVPHLLLDDNPTAAERKLAELKAIFTDDRLYLELQENGIDDQTKVNRALVTLSEKTGVPLVATNDCHYLLREHSKAHEVLLCIQTGRTMDDPKRFQFSTDQLYFKSPKEMKESFSWCPEAIKNTVKIAERCNLELTFGEHFFPAYPVEEGETLDSMFDREARAGFDKRLEVIKESREFTPELEKTYRDRLEMEIGVIKKMGFPGYFLVVADFINWAKVHDIPVGPGRGSGAGSLVAYSMQITDLDPLPYGLIFERFLNIERKSMPDFDVDFCQDRRGEVIEYVVDKYGGADHVAQIITYGSMKARGVIRDVGRALGMPYGDVDRIAKLVPEQLKITIPKALEEEPRLKDAMTHDPAVARLLEISMALEGLPRHTSTHAAGVVISPGPMYEYLPMARGSKDEVLTQYDMVHTEQTGLIKFDFLGLKTLTVINRAVKLIKSGLGKNLDISRIPLDDTATFNLLCKGDALGVFQLESSGMRDLLTKMKPELFTDLIALVALYRPGPLESGMVDDFVNTKHGRMVAKYPLPQLEPILKETYGVIVYQEQVMKIANVLANYSLGDADMLRRAMGKKKPEVMATEKTKFMAGSEANHVPLDKAENIFDLMAKFAGYGFNKSHSAAYALIAYQTAYLKAHYQAQLMAALLSCDMNNTDKVVLYISECRDHEIEVLPPDINESDQDFTVINERIRFGLAAVKNVGGAALDSVIEERKENGPYQSMEDFCNRVDSRRVNRRVIESLIKAGVFDSFGHKRSQLFAILDLALEQAQSAQRDKLSGQISLFGVLPQEQMVKSTAIVIPDIPEWSEKDRLTYEKETVGFYLTGHPLDSHRLELKMVTTSHLGELGEFNNRAVRVGGLIRSRKDIRSKKGDRMSFITLEDITGTAEIVVFPKIFAECAHLLVEDHPLVIQGKAEKEEDKDAKVIADEIISLDEACQRYTESARILLRADRISRQRMEEVKKLIQQNYGPCPVQLTIHFDKRGEVDIEMPKDFTIMPSVGFSTAMETKLGYASVAYTTRQPELKVQNNKSWQKKEPV
ncbi:MAG: DNA polymerase III subunit alpha [Proteobacteria bacterium]|nr:DNA polymerase III subunit alpha [Pseudomonadota bacterium]MBU1687688.1 DNA polymerase III subunit alpha [Pseudomonadota bacterium]